MPRTQKVFGLPPELQAELFRRITASNFGGYAELHAWLAEQGYPIGKSSLHRSLSPYGDELVILRRTKFLREASGGEIDLASALQAVSIRDLTEQVRILNAVAIALVKAKP